MGAPTDHVEQITGRPAEEFEVTARRYVQNPELVMRGLKVGGKLYALGLLLKTLLTPVPDLDRWESERGYPILAESQLAHESPEWRLTAQQKQLALLDGGAATLAAAASQAASSATRTAVLQRG